MLWIRIWANTTHTPASTNWEPSNGFITWWTNSWLAISLSGDETSSSTSFQSRRSCAVKAEGLLIAMASAPLLGALRMRITFPICNVNTITNVPSIKLPLSYISIKTELRNVQTLEVIRCTREQD